MSVSNDSAKQRDWRVIAARMLVVTFCVALVLSVVSIWARNQITDTDRYVRSVSPLARDADIQEAIADRVAAELSSQLGATVTAETLTGPQRYLAAPLALVVENYIRDVTLRVVASEGFAELWEQLNRAAHPIASAVLTGREGDHPVLDNGQITIDIEPVVTRVMDRLRDEGFDVVDQVQLDRVNTTFVLFEFEQVAAMQAVVDIIERLAIVLPVVALASLAGAVALAPDRRNVMWWAGIGTVAAMALLLAALFALRWWGVRQLPASVSHEAASAFFTTVTTYLRRTAVVVLAVGAGVVALVRYMPRASSEIDDPAAT